MQGVHYALPGVIIANGVTPMEPFHRHSPAGHIVNSISPFVKKSHKITRQESKKRGSIGDSVDGDTARARCKLAEIGLERAFYQRQAAQGKIRGRV